MGLAASQARLLTITARLADNELRSQTINNAKMRLAAESAQASNEYVSALNNAQLMFSNTSENGLAQTQALTFNALTQYSQYNNQYGIVNSSGQLLVSEKDAKIFEAHQNDLEGFLKAQGLEWDTTYFDDESDLMAKVKSFYGTGYNPTDPSYAYIGDLFNTLASSDKSLKELYLDAISQDASIENLNYNIISRTYYNNVLSLAERTYPDFRNYILGGSTSNFNENHLIDVISTMPDASGTHTATAEAVRAELLSGNDPANSSLVSDDDDKGAIFALDNIEQYLHNDDHYRTMILSLADVTINGQPSAALYRSTGNFSPGTVQGTATCRKQDDSGDDTYDTGIVSTFTLSDASGSYTITVTMQKDQLATATRTDGTTYQYKTGVKVNEISVPSGFTSPSQYVIDAFDPTDVSKIQALLDGIKRTGVATSPNSPSGTPGTTTGTTLDEFKYLNISTDPNNSQYVFVRTSANSCMSREAVYRRVIEEYLSGVLDSAAQFDAFQWDEDHGVPGNNLASLASEFLSYFPSGFTIDPMTEAVCLTDFDELLKVKNYNNTTDASGAITGTTFTGTISFANPALTERMKSVLGSYMVEKMVDVLGEPKFTWVDKSSMPTDNPDAKAQWLTNLFNRMQSGYKVLENGLANSREWMEYAFESGLVSMEQVDLSYNWISMDYKTCSSIFDDTDNTNIVAKAEAKYNRSMNDIKQKDSMYDLQLKNIDTEHTSLQTEYDVIKGVINKNIERTMKFDQSA